MPQTENDRRSRKRQKSMEDLQKHVPGAMKNAQPLDYDEYGIAKVPGDPAQKIAEAMGQNPGPGQPPGGPGPEYQQGQQNQQYRAAPPPPLEDPVPENKKAPHPVIANMLNIFGLAEEEKHVVTVYGQKPGENVEYTLTQVSEDIQAWILQKTQSKIVEIGDANLANFFQHLLVCTATVAIDGEPVWRLFDVKPQAHEAEQLIADPLNIPARIRKVCGETLGDMLWSQTKPVTSKLLEYYEAKILEGEKLISSLDRENEGRLRYVCVRDECSTIEMLIPEFDDEGNEKPYFCRSCSAQLSPTAAYKENSNIPLV